METIGLTLEQVLAQFLAFLPRLISGVVVFLVTLYLSAWVSRATTAALERRRLDRELIVLLSRLARLAVLVIGVIQALAQVEFDVTSLVAGLGIAGFTLGFALQDVAKNFVAGALLLLQQPFEIGDAIEVAGFSGRVLDITLRTTELRTWDGRRVLIPNGDVYVKPIVNFSRERKRRLQVSVSLKQGVDLEAVTRQVLQAVASAPGVLSEPAPEVAWTLAGDAAIELTAYFWVDAAAMDLRRAGNEAVAAARQAVGALVEEGVGFTAKAAAVESV